MKNSFNVLKFKDKELNLYMSTTGRLIKEANENGIKVFSNLTKMNINHFIAILSNITININF